MTYINGNNNVVGNHNQVTVSADTWRDRAADRMAACNRIAAKAEMDGRGWLLAGVAVGFVAWTLPWDLGWLEGAPFFLGVLAGFFHNKKAEAYRAEAKRLRDAHGIW